MYQMENGTLRMGQSRHNMMTKPIFVNWFHNMTKPIFVGFVRSRITVIKGNENCARNRAQEWRGGASEPTPVS
jgi:hypothetical protein